VTRNSRKHQLQLPRDDDNKRHAHTKRSNMPTIQIGAHELKYFLSTVIIYIIVLPRSQVVVIVILVVVVVVVVD